jgi:two-component system, NarL family, sensor histidine kinase UhpB
MEARSISLFWRIFAVNATLLSLVAVLLIVTPIEISAPIAPIQAVIIVAGFVVAMVANGLLSRRAIAPLERLAQRMDTVDLLRPGQRLAIGRDDEVGHVVRAFNRMLDRLESERRQSGQRMVAAHEDARVSVARDLHDEVGQLLTGVLLQLDSIADAAPQGRDEIDEAKEAVRRALDEVRRISSELRPEMLEHLGLLSALTELATTFGRASGIGVQREFDVSLPALEPAASLAIYRIAQESLTNVARHARADLVTIAIEGSHDSVVLRVSDNGRGFVTPMPEEHGGLRSMRERALLVDGALAIRQMPAGGVEVRLEVPLTPARQPVGVEA